MGREGRREKEEGRREYGDYSKLGLWALDFDKSGFGLGDLNLDLDLNLDWI